MSHWEPGGSLISAPINLTTTPYPPMCGCPEMLFSQLCGRTPLLPATETLIWVFEWPYWTDSLQWQGSLMDDGWYLHIHWALPVEQAEARDCYRRHQKCSLVWPTMTHYNHHSLPRCGYIWYQGYLCELFKMLSATFFIRLPEKSKYLVVKVTSKQFYPEYIILETVTMYFSSVHRKGGVRWGRVVGP